MLAAQCDRPDEPQVDIRGRQGRRRQDHMQLQPGRAVGQGARERANTEHRSGAQHIRRVQSEVHQEAHARQRLHQPVRDGDRSERRHERAAQRLRRRRGLLLGRQGHAPRDGRLLSGHRRGRQLLRGHEVCSSPLLYSFFSRSSASSQLKKKHTDNQKIKTRLQDELLRGRVRHGTHWSHAPLALFPHRRREGHREDLAVEEPVRSVCLSSTN